MDPSIEVEVLGHVALVWLSRPQKKNAVTAAMLCELNERVADIDARDEIHVGILAGRGPAFCSGADLSWATHSSQRPEDWLVMEKCRKVFVSALHGEVWGAGMLFALATDICVAALDTTFLLPEASRGLTPRLSFAAATRRLPPGEASLLALSRAPLGAQRAFDLGLVQRLTADAGNCLDEAKAIAQDIAKLDPRISGEMRRIRRAQPAADA